MATARRQRGPAASSPEIVRAAQRGEAAVDDLAKMRTDGDRLLLAIMQASLSLIGFGFTIYQIFSDAGAKAGIVRASMMANRVGISLLALGLILLSGGLWADAQSRRDLAARRAQLVADGLVPPQRGRALSPVFIVASLLLVVALTTLAVIVGRLFG